jgi:hypothetical protein
MRNLVRFVALGGFFQMRADFFDLDGTQTVMMLGIERESNELCG